jgi:Domain of unknown function (DUF4129)
MQRSSTTPVVAAAALGLTAAAVLVAIAARAPLSRATPVDARSAQAPTIAVFMVLIAAGILALTALVLVAWSGRRRKDDPPELEPPPMEVHWLVKLVATLLPLALVAALVMAALIGARRARTSTGLGSAGFGSAGFGAGRSLPTSSGSRNGFVVPAWFPWTALGIVVVAAAAGLMLLWLRRRRFSEGESKARATREAVEAAIDALDAEADPRRAVIAAYGAMQRTLGEQGIARSPTEAPREYLRRVLAASRATEREATTLTNLFEEARYSTHAIPERWREVALSSLHSLRSRLGAEGPA